jgi:hypothetical protein
MLLVSQHTGVCHERFLRWQLAQLLSHSVQLLRQRSPLGPNVRSPLALLPFSARVCLNQHHWLTLRMQPRNIDFQQPPTRSGCFLDGSLSTGGKSGYSFRLALGSSPAVGGIMPSYSISAVPATPNQTGTLYFCSFEDAVVRSSTAREQRMRVRCSSVFRAVPLSSDGRGQRQSADLMTKTVIPGHAFRVRPTTYCGSGHGMQ